MKDIRKFNSPRYNVQSVRIEQDISIHLADF